jgi:hypothetical protein
MFTRHSHKPLLGAAGLLIIMVALGSAGAEARPGDRAQRPHIRGDWTSHSERQRTDNGHTSHTTWTGSNGKTATRNATVVNDKDAQTRTRDVAYTGPDGKQASVHDVTQKTDSGYTRNSTFTNAQGESATRNAVVTNDKDNGIWTRDVTYTGVNGRTATSNTVTNRTDDGYTRDTTITGPKGGSGTREVAVACDKTAGHCTKDVAVNSNNK